MAEDPEKRRERNRRAQQAWRERQAQAGLVDLRLRVHPQDREAVERYAEKLSAQRLRVNANRVIK